MWSNEILFPQEERLSNSKYCERQENQLILVQNFVILLLLLLYFLLLLIILFVLLSSLYWYITNSCFITLSYNCQY